MTKKKTKSVKAERTYWAVRMSDGELMPAAFGAVENDAPGLYDRRDQAEQDACFEDEDEVVEVTLTVPPSPKKGKKP